jgi:uncharacterized protein YcbK (DUF882 family)
MNSQPLNNTNINEEISSVSRRKFLKKLGFVSLLAKSGTGVAIAAVRHVIYPDRHGHSQYPPPPINTLTRQVNPRIFTTQTQAQSHYRHGPGYKTLSFEHTHTGDKLKLTYYERGKYIKDALQEINYLLRDYRTDDIHPIDTALLDQLFDLNQFLGFNKPFHIISGYRSPFTNAQLRKHSKGVAEHSFHIQGRAIDIRVEGVSSKTIRNAALAMAQGGVGYYPENNFVHLDTGEFRSW